MVEVEVVVAARGLGAGPGNVDRSHLGATLQI